MKKKKKVLLVIFNLLKVKTIVMDCKTIGSRKSYALINLGVGSCNLTINVYSFVSYITLYFVSILK